MFRSQQHVQMDNHALRAWREVRHDGRSSRHKALFSLREVNMHDPVLEDTRESDEPDESLKEKERLLKEGQGMTIDEMASALAGGV
jgi:hypothetical protein